MQRFAPLLLTLLLTLLFSLPALAARSAPPTPFRVVAYLPDYRVQAFDPAAPALDDLTDLIFFSLEPTPAGGLDAARLTPAALAKLQAVKRRHVLRLWVAVGGWERSAGFAPVATDPVKRRQFAQALTLFCLGHGFGGADFDWEHPANAPEEAGYAALLAETQRAFAPHGLRLSVTMAPWQKMAPAGIAAVDAVNLMAYDHEGRHSTFAQAQADVAGFLRLGVPPRKITLGSALLWTRYRPHRQRTGLRRHPESVPPRRPPWTRLAGCTSTAPPPSGRRRGPRSPSISAASWSGRSARTRPATARC